MSNQAVAKSNKHIQSHTPQIPYNANTSLFLIAEAPFFRTRGPASDSYPLWAKTLENGPVMLGGQNDIRKIV